MLVVTPENFSDILAINTFMACGGLGPKSEEMRSVTLLSQTDQLPGRLPTTKKQIGSSHSLEPAL